MKYGLMKKAVCLVLMLVLLCGSAWAQSVEAPVGAPANAIAEAPAESALLRVLLRSLGNQSALDITLPALKARLHRARRKLAKELGEEVELG